MTWAGTIRSKIRPDQAIVGLSILIICSVFACVVPPVGRHEMVDHHIFLRATSLMRTGTGYYAAMDRALSKAGGPAETVRAFRMPTLLWAWAVLPTNRWIWYVYVGMVAAAGLAMLGLVEHPTPALVATLYLLCTANRPMEGGWLSQYAATELWVVPVVAFAALARQSRCDRLAAALAIVAALTRELAAPLLLGGLLAAWWDRRLVRPWLIALALACLAYAAHALCVQPYLVPTGQGGEPQLLGTARFPTSLLGMAGFGLPASLFTGTFLWCLTLVALAHPGHESRFMLPYLMLPLTGLIVDRPSWGVMIVPFLILWGGDMLARLGGRLKRVAWAAVLKIHLSPSEPA